MNLNRKKRLEENQLLAEQAYRMENDRAFWSECVGYLLEECSNKSEAQKVIEIADLLLTARQERFSL
jgi:hypothetical protein